MKKLILLFTIIIIISCKENKKQTQLDFDKIEMLVKQDILRAKTIFKDFDIKLDTSKVISATSYYENKLKHINVLLMWNKNSNNSSIDKILTEINYKKQKDSIFNILKSINKKDKYYNLSYSIIQKDSITDWYGILVDEKSKVVEYGLGFSLLTPEN